MPTLPDEKVITTWTNGHRASVQLVRRHCGDSIVVKQYRLRHLATMLREWLVMRHLADQISFIPRLIAFKFWRAQLHIEYIPGERLLEWVLKRYSPPDTDIGNFQSVHGLTTNPIISEAFAKFRQCGSREANSLRLAIRESYAALHALGWVHGSADPRNMIVNDGRVFIIDFDHARPCRDPQSLELPNLREWFGL